jgi:hypothetical protein
VWLGYAIGGVRLSAVGLVGEQDGWEEEEDVRQDRGACCFCGAGWCERGVSAWGVHGEGRAGGGSGGGEAVSARRGPGGRRKKLRDRRSNTACIRRRRAPGCAAAESGRKPRRGSVAVPESNGLWGRWALIPPRRRVDYP